MSNLGDIRPAGLENVDFLCTSRANIPCVSLALFGLDGVLRLRLSYSATYLAPSAAEYVLGKTVEYLKRVQPAVNAQKTLRELADEII